jgi:hypothetical protein
MNGLWTDFETKLPSGRTLAFTVPPGREDWCLVFLDGSTWKHAHKAPTAWKMEISPEVLDALDEAREVALSELGEEAQLVANNVNAWLDAREGVDHG